MVPGMQLKGATFTTMAAFCFTNSIARPTVMIASPPMLSGSFVMADASTSSRSGSCRSSSSGPAAP